MKTWVPLLFLMVTARVTCGADASPSPLLWTYQYVMATAWDERDFAVVVDQAIEETRYSDLPPFALPDFAAQVLLDHADDASFPPDSQVRLLKVLIAAKSRRYEPVFMRIQESAREPWVSGWAQSGRRRLFRDADQPYQPASVDTRAIVAAADAAALAARPTREQRAHFAAFPGGTIADLFAWAGVPHHVSSWRSRFADNTVGVRPHQLNFYYRGLGRVVFGFSHLEGSWQLSELTVDPLAFEDEFPYRARAAQLGLPDDRALAMAQLLSDAPAAMRVATRRQLDSEDVWPEFLDSVAEILATAPTDTADGMRTDAQAWMCRLLAQRGGSRYAPVLERLAEIAGTRKLRRYAQKPVTTLQDAPGGAYRPGTLSLEAQRAKYPSPYVE